MWEISASRWFYYKKRVTGDLHRAEKARWQWGSQGSQWWFASLQYAACFISLAPRSGRYFLHFLKIYGFLLSRPTQDIGGSRAGLEYGWRIFLRACAVIADNLRRNYFACGKPWFSSTIFPIITSDVFSVSCRLVPQAASRLVRPLARPSLLVFIHQGALPYVWR